MKVKVFPKKFLYSTKKNWPKYIEKSILKELIPKFIECKENFEHEDCTSLEFNTNDIVLDFFISICYFHNEHSNDSLYDIPQKYLNVDTLQTLWTKLKYKNRIFQEINDVYIDLKMFIDMYDIQFIHQYISFFYNEMNVSCISVKEFCIFDDFMVNKWKYNLYHEIVKKIRYDQFKTFVEYSWCLNEDTSKHLSKAIFL